MAPLQHRGAPAMSCPDRALLEGIPATRGRAGLRDTVPGLLPRAQVPAEAVRTHPRRAGPKSEQTAPSPAPSGVSLAGVISIRMSTAHFRWKITSSIGNCL